MKMTKPRKNIFKKALDIYSHIGIYSCHGKSSYNFRPVQRRGRAPPTRDPGVSGEPGARGGADRGGDADGAAFGLQTPEGAARGRAGAGAAQWAPHAVPDECAGDPSAARMDEVLREVLDAAA